MTSRGDDPPIRSSRLRIGLLLLGLASASGLGFLQEPAAQSTPENRAVSYLQREVPRWRPRNGCFSCHNNGDGARALYVAAQHEYAIPEPVLEGTSEWLSKPLLWDENKGEPRFGDNRLARIQFSASLAEASRAGLIPDHQVLVEAARSLLPHQAENGSWPIDDAEKVGSPVTYGVPLATYMALRTLQTADPQAFAGEIERGRHWLLQLDPKSVPDIAALLFALSGSSLPAESDSYQSLLAKLLEGQKSDGGWGPYRFSPTEIFDTALALLVLSRIPEPESHQRETIRRGREYLVRSQLDSGGWIETTRPSGFSSYAQHISTTAWATLALIETRRLAQD